MLFTHRSTSATSASRAACAAALLLVAAGCGGGKPGQVATTALDGIAISPGRVDVPAGLSAPLTVTASYSDATTREVTGEVTWASTDESVATVIGGTVATHAPGAATITARLGDLTASVPVSVTDARLDTLSISPDLPSAPAGVATAFAAAGLFSDGSARDVTAQVTWSSADPAIATISPGGLAQALAAGETAITAALGSATASTTLTVTAATLVSLDVLPPEAVVAKGTGTALQAMAGYSDGEVVDVSAQALWTSSGDAVGVSTAGGQVIATGLAVGDASVTATFGGLSDTATVTVSSAILQALAVAPPSSSLPVGLDQALVATGTFSDQSTQDLTALVSWTTVDTTIVSVSAAGVVTALGAGTATVVATLGDVSARMTVTVIPATLQRIAVQPATASLPARYKLQLRAIGTFSDASTYDVTAQATWTTGSSALLAISNSTGSKGLATGVAPGPVAVTATLAGVSGSASIQVTSATLASIAVAPSEFSVRSRATVQLVATGTFDDATTLDLTTQCAWRSSAKRIARVSQAGVVTGARRGSVTITATKAGQSRAVTGTVF